MTFTTNLNDTKIIGSSMTDIVSAIQSQLADQKTHRLVNQIKNQRSLDNGYSFQGDPLSKKAVALS